MGFKPFTHDCISNTFCVIVYNYVGYALSFYVEFLFVVTYYEVNSRGAQ